MSAIDEKLQTLIDKEYGNITVLLVDDQPFVRRIVINAFHGLWNIHFLEAGDGNHALRHLAGQNVTAVIMDINMLPMNGLEALKAIRTGSDGIRADMPVAMLTGVADEKAVKAAVMLDANGFILKPATPNILRERLLRILSTEMPLKKANDYYQVDLPTGLDENLLTQSDMADTKKKKDEFEVREGFEAVNVSVDEVRQEDRLLTDIKTINGQLMVSAGTTVSPSLLDKINDLSKIVRNDPLTVERKKDEE